MQSGSCLAFGMPSASLLLPLLCFLRSACFPQDNARIQAIPFAFWKPCFLSLLGVILASAIKLCHAGSILLRFWHTFCFYSTSAVESRKAVQVFGIRLQLGTFSQTSSGAEGYQSHLSYLGQQATSIYLSWDSMGSQDND